MEKITTDNQLDAYCRKLAENIAEETKEHDRRRDLVSEFADQSEHVIYYGNAHAICQNCRIWEGESYYADMYGEGPAKSYDEIATIMAYGEIRARICFALDKIEQEANND